MSTSDSELRVRRLTSTGDCIALEGLQKAAWGFDDLQCVPRHILWAIAKDAGQILGAFDGKGNMIGFTVGLISKDRETGESYLTSHMAAVLPEYHARNVGYRLKLAQRKEAINDGFSRIDWTYDPMLTKNANLNIRKLGGRVVKFFPNLYGEITSGLYQGLPTDRFLVSWRLSDLGGTDFPADCPAVVQPNGHGPAVSSAALQSESAALRCAVPLDIATLKRESLDRAIAWQSAIREVSTALLDGRYQVSGFRRAPDSAFGEYLFTKVSV